MRVFTDMNSLTHHPDFVAIGARVLPAILSPEAGIPHAIGPSVPTVRPSSGSPAARKGAATRSRSATTSALLIGCQPGIGWLCMKATPIRD